MKKFFLLLNKEIRELLTPQMIVPFVVVILVFSVIGNIAGDQAKKQAETKQKILISNQSQGVFSSSSIEAIKSIADVEEVNSGEGQEFIDGLKDKGINAGLYIPADFDNRISIGERADIKTYALINNFSLTATSKYAILDASVQAANDQVSNILISQSGQDPVKLKNPIIADSYVTSKGVTEKGSAIALIGYVSQQTTYVPIILFIVIVFAAQMIASTVATEKENKTLETLLSLPVSRRAIVSAKMLAAGLVSLLMAGVYMFGLRNFTTGISSQGMSMGGGDSTVQGVSELAGKMGLTYSTLGYVELGVVLFLGILLALAIAMILGAFSEDAKSAQGVIAPLMVSVLIPYFLIMFLDISQLSVVIRYIIYAIPFSHIFLAAPNILLGNHMFILYGSIYLLVLFIIAVYAAAKIFSSDLILTMKLNFSKKK